MKRAAGDTLLACLVLAVTACSTSDGPNDSATDLGNPGNCLQIDIAVSPEKIDLLTSLAQTFNRSRTKVGDQCVFVSPKSKASGGAMQALADGWDEDAEGPPPVVWSPASSAWGAILDQRRADEGQPAMANQGTPFMNTPLVIAMPQPMAEALGWPEQAARLVRHPLARPRAPRAGRPSATPSGARSSSARRTRTSRRAASRR